MRRTIFLPLLLCLGAPVSAADVATFTLRADPQPIVQIQVKRGTMPARVGLGFEKALILTLARAEEAKLKAFPLVGKQKVSNRLIPGGTAVFRGNFYDVAIAGLPKLSAPTVWVDKAVDDSVEALLSVMAINASQVVIDQPSAPAGGTTIRLPLTAADEVTHQVTIGETKIRLRLDLKTPNTIMNAKAARALELAGLVSRAGKVGLWAPFPGVALPYETLDPAPGAAIAGLPLAAPQVRITEERAKALDAEAKAGTSTAEDQSDAIVVTGAKEDKTRPWMIVGRDVLSRCSRIVLDKPGRQWLLTCNFG